MSEKSELRREYKRRRSALLTEEHERLGAAVEARLIAHPRLERVETVYSYLAFGREVPTAGILRCLLARGARVLAPPAARGADPLTDALLLLAPDSPGEAFAVTEDLGGKFSPSEVDLFLVPGIVWDLRGYRIGFGGGFFDRLLSAARPDARAIGLSFELQLVERVPADPWDIPVHEIVTETRVWTSAGSRF